MELDIQEVHIEKDMDQLLDKEDKKRFKFKKYQIY